MTDRENPERPHRKRPLGATLLSLLMGWLTLSAIGNAMVFPAAGIGWPAYFTVLAVAYAVTAGATAVGLWRMRPWTLTAFRAWGVVLLVLMIVFSFFFQVPQLLKADPVGQGILLVATTGTMVLVYWLMHRYIKRYIADPD
ncbi:hypothetical protein AAFN88_02855 [Pelagibius sp. CAU 1746]|uniref:hypothetical protein n=1 Tax=Pelagibius sp. CAU 1746 TaxID=3140370 RepID=UPI00325AB1BA